MGRKDSTGGKIAGAGLFNVHAMGETFHGFELHKWGGIV